MKLDDYRTSDNVRDQGRGGSPVGFGSGGMGGGLGLIIQLVASRFGIVGVIVVIAGAWMLGLFGGGGQSVVSPGQGGTAGASAEQVCSAAPERRFSCQVLASTEDTWGRLYQASGRQYQPAKFAFYEQGVQSGCGAAQSAMGPFYCPTDNSIYLDTTFYDELRTRFGAAGDFAQAYVIAHEVGHHIQQINGTLGQVQQQQQALGQAEGNALQVRVELQADCLAGVWAARNRDRLEPGDVQEGMTAAAAIGDDTLQKQAQGRVVPESFTHGSAAQRQAWLKRGLDTGDPAACDTFSGRV